jgi:uncharacterized integral membrane protein
LYDSLREAPEQRVLAIRAGSLLAPTNHRCGRLLYLRALVKLIYRSKAEKMHFKLAISLVLAGLTVLFVIQNVAVVEVRFLFWSLSMSLALFVFLLFAIGIIVGWLLHSYAQHRKERAKNRLNAV